MVGTRGLKAFVSFVFAAAPNVRAVGDGLRVPRACLSSPRGGAVSCVARFGGTPMRPEEEEQHARAAELPSELAGGWEVRSSYSGAEETWVELLPDGSAEGSARSFSRGRGWRAAPRESGKVGWHLTVTSALPPPHTSAPRDRRTLGGACRATVRARRLRSRYVPFSRPRSGPFSPFRRCLAVEDKISSPLTFDGTVREDEYVGLSYSGRVLAPSKRTGQPAEVGEFRAWQR